MSRRFRRIQVKPAITRIHARNIGRKTPSCTSCVRYAALSAVACAASGCITGGTSKALWTGENLGSYHYAMPVQTDEMRGINNGELHYY